MTRIRCWGAVVGAFAALPLAGCMTDGAFTSGDKPATARAEARGDLSGEKSAEVCMAAASALHAQGHVAEAAAQYEKALNFNPKLTIAGHRLALALDDMNEHGRAVTMFQRLTTEKANDPDLWCDFGYSYHSHDQHAEAEQCFRTALKLNVKHERSWVNLGLTLAATGHPAEALDAFRHSVPPAEAYCNLGVVQWMKLGQHERAKASFEQALALEPSNAKARAALVKLHQPGIGAAAVAVKKDVPRG